MKSKYSLLFLVSALLLSAYLINNSTPSNPCLKANLCKNISLSQQKQEISKSIQEQNIVKLRKVILSARKDNFLNLLISINKDKNYLGSCQKNNIILIKAILPELSISQVKDAISHSGFYCSSTLRAAFILSSKLSFEEKQNLLINLCTYDTDIVGCIDTIGYLSYLAGFPPKISDANCSKGFFIYRSHGQSDRTQESFVNGCYMGYRRASYVFGYWDKELSLSARDTRLCQGAQGIALVTCRGDLTRYLLNQSTNRENYLTNLTKVKSFCNHLGAKYDCGPYVAYATVDFLVKLNSYDLSTLNFYLQKSCLTMNSSTCLNNFIGWFSDYGTWGHPENYHPDNLLPLCSLLDSSWAKKCLTYIEENKQRHIAREKVKNE